MMSNSVEIEPGQTKYTVSKDAKEMGDPGMAGTIAPMIPVKDSKTANIINISKSIVVMFKTLILFFCNATR